MAGVSMTKECRRVQPWKHIASPRISHRKTGRTTQTAARSFRDFPPMPIPLLLYLAPLMLAFEVWQLVIAERYVGVKSIARDLDPRDLGPGELVSFLWTMGIVFSYLWTLLMLVPRFGRVQIICMLLVSVTGLSLRRNLGLRWLLVILTLEGALRIGMILSMLGLAWRQLG